MHRAFQFGESCPDLIGIGKAKLVEYATLSNAVTGFPRRIEVGCANDCPLTTREYWPIWSQLSDTSGNRTTNLDDNFWSVIFGQGALTYIQLPGSNYKVYLSSLTQATTQEICRAGTIKSVLDLRQTRLPPGALGIERAGRQRR